MFALSRILVPSNLGQPSTAAVRYGVAFARQFGAKLFVVQVLGAKEFDAAIETERVMETLLPEAGPRATTELDLRDVAKNAARENLSRLLEPDEQRSTQAEYLLRAAGAHAAGPGDAILACAEELDVQLIVMGKHRQGFIDHLLGGSVTEKVIRKAPCPVLIVHYPEQEFVVEGESGSLGR